MSLFVEMSLIFVDNRYQQIIEHFLWQKNKTNVFSPLLTVSFFFILGKNENVSSNDMSDNHQLTTKSSEIRSTIPVLYKVFKSRSFHHLEGEPKVRSTTHLLSNTGV